MLTGSTLDFSWYTRWASLVHPLYTACWQGIFRVFGQWLWLLGKAETMIEDEGMIIKPRKNSQL